MKELQMKKIQSISILLLVLPALLLWGCSADQPTDPSGLVDPFTLADASARYAAIGNSLTAGFMDGGLMQAGQADSYPQLIARQLGLDAAQFTQPWIAFPGIGSSDPSSPAKVAGVLYFDGAGISVVGETDLVDVQTDLLLAVAQPTPYHNLAVPGATLYDGMNAYDSLTCLPIVNPFFDFINRASFFGNISVPAPAGYPAEFAHETGSMFYKAVAKGPALITVWMGNNDVLGPATSGDPDPGFGAAGAAEFSARYSALLQSVAGALMGQLGWDPVAQTGLKPTIVTANIPSVSSIPYFMTLETFNAASGGGWPWNFEEQDVALVLFPVLSWLTEDHYNQPIPSEYTLTSAERTDVDTAVATYNQIIAGVTAAVNASEVAKCGMVDAKGLLEDLTDAQRTHFLFLLPAFQGDVQSAAAATYFSLDGIHPNNVGYGVVANAFIAKINELDGSAIPDVDLDTLSWDPTYGQTKAGVPAAGQPLVSARAAAGMAAIFR